MRITKPNLLVAAILHKADSAAEELQFLHITNDGTTVASDGKSILACSPAPQDEERAGLYESIPRSEPPALGLNIRPEMVKQIQSLMPREIPLQNAILSRCDADRIEFSVVGKARINRVEALPLFSRFPEWRRYFREAISRLRRSGRQEIALPRRRLLRLLQAMDDASSDKSDAAPVYLMAGDSDDPIILRVRNFGTEQDIIGLIMPFEYKENLNLISKWARLLLGLAFPKMKKKKENRHG